MHRDRRSTPRLPRATTARPMQLVGASATSTGEAKSDRLLEVAVSLTIPFLPLSWLASFDKASRAGEWNDHLWIIAYTGEYLRRHWSFPLRRNTDQPTA